LKEHASGCAGCYTALTALELYAEAFDSAGALDKLEGFASFHGPDFYGLPRNTGKVSLQRQTWTLPESLPFGQTSLKPLRAGEELGWRLMASTSVHSLLGISKGVYGLDGGKSLSQNVNDLRNEWDDRSA
jgi:hypothetical protein